MLRIGNLGKGYLSGSSLLLLCKPKKQKNSKMHNKHLILGILMLLYIHEKIPV